MNFSDYTEDEIMTLPLDYYTDYQSGTGEEEDWKADGDTTWYSDTEYEVDAWYYWSEAYGTLETPDDGTIDVIKITYQWIWSQWEADEASDDGQDKLVDFDNGTEIYFYSKDGHQLMISIDSLGVETTGLVKPDYVYYQKVRKSGSSVEEEQSAVKPRIPGFPQSDERHGPVQSAHQLRAVRRARPPGSFREKRHPGESVVSAQGHVFHTAPEGADSEAAHPKITAAAPECRCSSAWIDVQAPFSHGA